MRIALIVVVSCALIASVFGYEEKEKECERREFPNVCSSLNYLTCTEQKFVSSLQALNPSTCPGHTCSCPS